MNHFYFFSYFDLAATLDSSPTKFRLVQNDDNFLLEATDELLNEIRTLTPLNQDTRFTMDREGRMDIFESPNVEASSIISHYCLQNYLVTTKSLREMVEEIQAEKNLNKENV
jgi:hypothetical protein